MRSVNTGPESRLADSQPRGSQEHKQRPEPVCGSVVEELDELFGRERRHFRPSRAGCKYQSG